MEFNLAPDIQKHIEKIVKKLDFPHIDAQRIVCFRSSGSTSRAQARIWSLPTIWQKALKVKAHYCIEVLTEKYDRLKKNDQTKVLIHELLHIPKTFSGALLPHRGRGKVKIDTRTVNKWYKKLKQADK
jgi:predicted metallopeptidase